MVIDWVDTDTHARLKTMYKAVGGIDPAFPIILYEDGASELLDLLYYFANERGRILHPDREFEELSASNMESLSFLTTKTNAILTDDCDPSTSINTAVDGVGMSHNVNLLQEGNRLTVSLNSGSSGWVTVYNAIGQQILNTSVHGASTNIDLSAFSPGYYLLKTAVVGGSEETRSILIQ